MRMGQNLFTDFAPILFKIIQNFGVNDFEPYLHLPHLVTCSMAALTLPVFQLCWEAETTAISGALVAVHFFQASRIQTWGRPIGNSFADPPAVAARWSSFTSLLPKFHTGKQ